MYVLNLTLFWFIKTLVLLIIMLLLYCSLARATIHKVKNKIGKFILEPLGVVLAISPFNYPINLLISKLAPALISGNTVVYKPATQGSLVGAFISELFSKIDFKPGIVNCVIGQGKEIGDLLVSHPFVKMISFTGSANVGNHIAKIAYKVPLVLEMGGKDPAIVLDDADIDLAASEIVKNGDIYAMDAIIKYWKLDPSSKTAIWNFVHSLASNSQDNLSTDSSNITVAEAEEAYSLELVNNEPSSTQAEPPKKQKKMPEISESDLATIEHAAKQLKSKKA